MSIPRTNETAGTGTVTEGGGVAFSVGMKTGPGGRSGVGPDTEPSNAETAV